MRLGNWFEKRAKIKLLKKGKFLTAMRHTLAGYSIGDDGVEVYFRKKESPLFLTFEETGYSKEKLSEFHKALFVLDHPSSNKPVKKEVYIIEVTNGQETLIVESKSSHIFEEMCKQYEAIDYIPNREIKWRGQSICLNRNLRAIGHRTEKRIFPTIVDYSNWDDEVRVEKRLS